MYIDNLIERVLQQTSPAELRVIRERDFTTAEDTCRWLVHRVIRDLTPSQIESVAFRMAQQVRN